MKTGAFATNSDEQLIAAYLKGDMNSLGILYKRYYSRVYQKCFSFTKNPDDAFDLSQDILMKTFAKLSTFQGKSKFSTWLYAITQNYCISMASKPKNCYFEDVCAEQNIIDDAPEMEELEQRMSWEKKELMLSEAMTNVNEPDRNLLHLKYNRNYSVKDIQDEYNLSASAVKMRLMRARQKVEQYIYQMAM